MINKAINQYVNKVYNELNEINTTLDKMIQLICFSDMFATEEKEKLIKKLTQTTSVYYKTPFWDGNNLKFNPGGIHGRFTSRRIQDKTLFAEQLKTIQEAINNLGQIRFKFNCYTADHTMIPKTDYTHVLSPYHLVVYHDNYYCIGLKEDDKRVWHYRVDLMSDVEIVRDEEGKMVIAQVCAFEGLPISNACWDPEKYMSEHLNMAYDSPKDIRIKIKNTDYTILHDWFGNHYEKTTEACEEGYDVVLVKTSPSMIVHWAMQYGTNVEIMDEEIRAKIRDEIKELESDNTLVICNKNNINEIIITDDAGLCVDSLNGEPGVYSARYAGDHAPQEVVLNTTS